MTDQGPSLDRAVKDYLAHSRSHDLYESEEAYWRADDAWWDRVMWALQKEFGPLLGEATRD